MAIIDTKRRKRRKKRRAPVQAKRKPTPKPVPRPAAQPTPKPAPSPTPTPSSPAATPVTGAPAPTARERLHLNRFGTGFTPKALDQLRAAGTPEAWLTAQLQLEQVAESPRIAQVDGWFPDLRRTAAQKWATQIDRTKGGWEYGHDLGNWSILRRIYSERAVLETMTDFWSTFLHIPIGHDRAWVWRFDYDATIRRNALGTFEDLLTECSLHPAMRLYLDNWKSVKGRPNENQGRELLELHTVGRGAGYTEAMVKSSATLLSGYTVDWGTSFEPRYDTSVHTTGAVQVLDFTHDNSSSDGQAATRAYLKHLANHPATARNIATKMARYFVSDSPSTGLVDTLANAYTSSGTNIAAVLKVLSVHPEFLTSEGLKVRTPIADLVATARVLGVDVNAGPTGDNYARHGNWTQGGPTLFSWPRPDGPPVTGEAWSSASRLFSSWSMHRNQTGGWWPKGAAYRAPASWLPRPSLRFDALVNHLCLTWLGRPADARLQQVAQQATDVSAATIITSQHAIVRWKMPRLALALLDTPDHMTT